MLGVGRRSLRSRELNLKANVKPCNALIVSFRLLEAL